MTETKLKQGRLEVYLKSYDDIRICPVNVRATTIATMGIWSGEYRDELLAYAELFASAPTLQAKIDQLEAEKAELVKALTRLDRIAALISDDRHQKAVTPDSDWSELYSARVETRSVLAKHEPKPKEV